MTLAEAVPTKSPSDAIRTVSKDDATARVCIIQDAAPESASSFLKSQSDNLPARILVIDGVLVPQVAGRPLLTQSTVGRAWRKALRRSLRRPWNWELTWAYLKAFRSFKPQAVLAQFGQ